MFCKNKVGELEMAMEIISLFELGDINHPNLYRHFCLYLSTSLLLIGRLLYFVIKELL